MINGNKVKYTILNNIALIEWNGHRRNINRYTTGNFHDIKIYFVKTCNNLHY